MMSKPIEDILIPKPEARLRIYAYSIDDDAHRGLLKIGQTARDVRQRIAEQLRTAAIENYTIELEELAERGEHRPGTRLIYCVERHSDLLYQQRLTQLTAACAISLTILERDRDGLLDARLLLAQDPGPCWFCGPEGMREMLLQYLPRQQLHYEQFEFR